ncbi:MAG: hypothetical protein K1X89_25215 [Myxococcaceae bacterium]|nr:hypothetical protein [Myxococcaceae bacterium]
MIRFVAVPAWQLEPPVKGKAQPAPERLEPPLHESPEVLVEALARSEFRGENPLEYADALFARGGSTVFAKPPQDLPALLRLADQLVLLARQEAGERARAFVCECGTRYAVPVALLRPVAIPCERCGRSLELDATKSDGEESIAEPFQGRVNACRKALSDFFREAMARGWPVLVERPSTP